MSIKKQVIKESISRAEIRLAEIDRILEATPLVDIIQGKKEVIKIVRRHKGNHSKIAELIAPLAEKEKEYFEMAKKQENSVELVREKVKIESELMTLKNELFHIEKNK